MNIVITGASGFLGKSLTEYFLLKGYNITPVSRNDFINNDLLYKKLQNCNAIINLAGESIIKRWNKKNRFSIENSRITTTHKIVDFLNSNFSNVHLINASAIGIYDSFSKHDETSIKFSSNFLYNVIEKWEKEANNLNSNNILSKIRIGIVLGNKGGAFKQYYSLVKNFIGGKIGNGQQFTSFIHINDFCNAIDFILNNKISGVINMTSPYPTTNAILINKLGNYLNRPTLFSVPKFVLKILFGSAHVLFTEGQYVTSNVLKENGFIFKYANIEDSINALIKSYPE